MGPKAADEFRILFLGDSITLSGLYMIDPEGRQGQPGEGSGGPDAVRAYYFIGRKEKWTVTRTGVVALK